MSSETILKPYDKTAFAKAPWSRAGKGFCSRPTCTNTPTHMVVQAGNDQPVRSMCDYDKVKWEERKLKMASKAPNPDRIPEKALRYIAEGRLTVAARSADSALILVQGTDPEPYRTTFAGNVWQCTCKAAQNGLKCAHVQAARAITGLVEQQSVTLGTLPAPPKAGGIDTGSFWEREAHGQE
jgi:hypothetical protein